MTDLSDSAKLVHKAKHKIRFVTAASLFDGHDASINIMRRILQASGAEVIHLGHNRSVEEIVNAALQEDVQGIAVSSYQGGHVEYFRYMVDLLKSRGGAHVKVFGGGAGKSSLTDELVRRFRLDQGDELGIAVISVDPTRRKTGGALLGDRIRMNAIHGGRTFMRSLATRDTGSELSAAIGDAIAACKAADYQLIIVETAGIGQGDAAIAKHADISLYVMTPE